MVCLRFRRNLLEALGHTSRRDHKDPNELGQAMERSNSIVQLCGNISGRAGIACVGGQDGVQGIGRRARELFARKSKEPSAAVRSRPLHLSRETADPPLEMTSNAMIQQRDAKLPAEPAESRTFSIVESVVLVAGFAVAGGFLSHIKAWPRRAGAELAVALLLYLALGLSLSGPVLVSWRERLGRKRPVWGLGESLWFAFGILVQDVVASAFLSDRLRSLTALLSIALIFVLPIIYLTGNPRVEFNRAPLSWSNLVGLLSVVLWALTILCSVQS
jgi:hypothetical protein